MFTIIGSILGFATSLAPSIIDLFKAKERKEQDERDHRHSMEEAEFQLKAQLALAGKQLEIAELNVDAEQMRGVYAQAQQPVGYKWVEALIGTVRPIITYSFFAEVAFIKTFLTIHLIKSGVDFQTIHDRVLDETFMCLFATILSFWFGTRMFKPKGK